MSEVFRSLTGRLVATAAALVVLVTLVIGAATILGARASLTERLDQDVRASLARAEHLATAALDGFGPDDFRGPPDGFDGEPGAAVDSLTVVWAEDGDAVVADVIVQEDGGRTLRADLSDEALDELADVAADGDAHSVDLPGLGSYRIMVRELPSGARVATGLPTEDVDALVGNLVLGQVVLITLGALVAVGVGTLVIRHHLRPLREVAATAHAVAELSLDRGRIEVTDRVPEEITGSTTEAGQVGRALNTLLAHVDAALGSRQASEDRVRRFVADASHELRTPLATIAGYTELARRRPEDGETQQLALAKVESESHRMTRLVEDLLLLARLDSGLPLQREPVDLTRLAVESVQDARVVAPDHTWALELPDHAVEVPGDQHRLHQVITNLLTNAAKYTPAGSTVHLEIRDDGFVVSDNGPGFPDDFAAQAFERFSRADGARKRQGGAGLGLALVQAIVEAHDGRVELSSAPGSTRLTVVLPTA